MNKQSDGIRNAVEVIKTAILTSQYRATRIVNRELLSLYYGVGRFVSENSRNGYWGKGAIDAISQQLQKELPGLRGFSGANLKKMRIFYEQWSPVINRSPLASELKLLGAEGQIETRTLTSIIRSPEANELDYDEFLSLSFTHHYEILSKTQTIEERGFYIHQAYTNQWDKYRLREMLNADLYHRQGELPNNFATTMSDTRSALRAIEMFKDEYLLDFINVEELGERDRTDIDERMVEQAIIHNVKNFIMTFGRDFTFVGNQYHLEKYGHSMYPDLLFYNRELMALVVVELKRGEFKPSYLGQLSAYLRILDSEVKKPFENPSIGIILCKEADKSFVKFLIQGYDNPMGVATYKSAEDVRKVLPSEEELQRLMDEQ